ncbi:hypothetical protein [Rummeliibacillus stabekisii]|uniref:hypothetical protein n=1 Tax=Rummeliibacillus stabekisii TaxID=241244 RepID=UPI00371D4645
MTNNNKQVYIKSIEASDIYGVMVRGSKLKETEYNGMLPYSLESEKLKSMKGFNTFTKNKTRTKKEKEESKQFSNDIINVQFKQGVTSGKELIKKLQKKIDEYKVEMKKQVDSNKEYINEKEYKRIADCVERCENYKSFIVDDLKNNERNPKWKKLSRDQLREKLYTEGFKLTHENWILKKVDGEFKRVKESEETIEYVFYKRSSAKSRTGKCLFIKKELYEEMINWSRLGLHEAMKKAPTIDLPSLMSYESLVGSSIEDTLYINPDNIFIINDVDSKFKDKVNVVQSVTCIEDGNTKEKLDSITKDDYEIENSIWDGQSLLDISYFTDGTSMKLLRNHMFKSASFATDIQQFLKDNHPEDIEYDNWELYDMFGNKMFAKDIQLIITPNSLKALKFAKFLDVPEDEQKKEMYQHWKKIVKNEGCVFGVVKHEKPSKLGFNEEGQILQQTSYQLLNTLPAMYTDIEELATFELKYIEQLKNNDDVFADYLLKTANAINSNQMMYELYKRNSDFAGTNLFRGFRAKTIFNYINHVKKGHLKLVADNCVLFGNPYEMLLHTIGKFKEVKSIALHDNQVYTKLFDWNEELVGVRHPHTSSSNFAHFINAYNEKINTYFKLSKNIIVINSIGVPIMDRLSGSDFDSDTIYVSNSKQLVALVKKVYGKYNVVVNGIEIDEVAKYRLTFEDACKVDNKLAVSQRVIGEVVNLGQLAQSVYWNLKAKGEKEEVLNTVLKYTDLVTIFSMLAIDMAKRFYKIDLKAEIEKIKSALQEYMPTIKKDNKVLKAEPNFFKLVKSQSKNANTGYITPMDHLQLIMSVKDADDHEVYELPDLLIEKEFRGYNRKQEELIVKSVNEYANKVANINAIFKGLNDEDVEKDKFIQLNNAVDNLNNNLIKMKMTEETVYAIVFHVIKNKNCRSIMKLFNTLFKLQHDKFMNSFTQKNVKK